MSHERSYWCFISYRHADNKEEGRQWATWLHQKIETYEVPEDLVGTKNPRGEMIPDSIFPVFRDEDELPADADIASPIYRALDHSRFLLVLCSPRAVQSTYVANEISYFKSIGKSNQVLAAIIDGEPNASWDKGKKESGIDPTIECFPVPLQYEIGEDRQIDEDRRAEPIAADFRTPDGSQGWTSPEAYREELSRSGGLSRHELQKKVAIYQKQCDLAFLKIIAGVLGVPLGSLTERDKAYQLDKERRRTKIFRRVAAAMLVLFVAAAVGGVYALLQSKEAEHQRSEAELQRDEAGRQRDVADAQKKEAQRQEQEAGRQRDAAEKERIEAERQRDLAKRQRERADIEAENARQQAYRSQLRIAADLIGQQELAEARKILLEVPPSVRRWEWAYLISRCGATPRDLTNLKPDAKWLTEEMINRLNETLNEAPSGASSEERLSALEKAIKGGRRTILTTGSWRGGGHAIVFQGKDPAPQFSYWCGMYSEPGRTALGGDGSLIVWDCKYGEMGGRPANLWTGDLVVSERSVAPVPERIGFPFDVADGSGASPTPSEGLLDPGWLRYGPHTFGGGTSFSPPLALELESSGNLRVVSATYDDLGGTRWLLQRWNRSEAPLNLLEENIQKKWPESYSTGINSLDSIDEPEIANFQIAMIKKDIQRKFCCWVTVGEKRLALLEGNGLELWDPATVEPVRQLCEAGGMKADDEDNMGVGTWMHDASLVGDDGIVGWLPREDGGRFLAIGKLEDAKPITFLQGSDGKPFPEQGFDYSIVTKLTASPHATQVIFELSGRNESLFLVWDAASGEQIIATDDEQPNGFGWPPDERFLALVDHTGSFALYERFGGKVIREYPGISISGGSNMPVRYSPDGSRILISNLLVDAVSLDPLLLLREGTVISENWKTAVTWVDGRTAEISSTAFWDTLNGEDGETDLLWSERLLLNEISNQEF